MAAPQHQPILQFQPQHFPSISISQRDLEGLHDQSWLAIRSRKPLWAQLLVLVSQASGNAVEMAMTEQTMSNLRASNLPTAPSHQRAGPLDAQQLGYRPSDFVQTYMAYTTWTRGNRFVTFPILSLAIALFLDDCVAPGQRMICINILEFYRRVTSPAFACSPELEYSIRNRMYGAGELLSFVNLAQVPLHNSKFLMELAHASEQQTQMLTLPSPIGTMYMPTAASSSDQQLDRSARITEFASRSSVPQTQARSSPLQRTHSAPISIPSQPTTSQHHRLVAHTAQSAPQRHASQFHPKDWNSSASSHQSAPHSAPRVNRERSTIGSDSFIQQPESQTQMAVSIAATSQIDDASRLSDAYPDFRGNQRPLSALVSKSNPLARDRHVSTAPSSVFYSPAAEGANLRDRAEARTATYRTAHSEPKPEERISQPQASVIELDGDAEATDLAKVAQDTSFSTSVSPSMYHAPVMSAQDAQSAAAPARVRAQKSSSIALGAHEVRSTFADSLTESSLPHFFSKERAAGRETHSSRSAVLDRVEGTEADDLSKLDQPCRYGQDMDKEEDEFRAALANIVSLARTHTELVAHNEAAAATTQVPTRSGPWLPAIERAMKLRRAFRLSDYTISAAQPFEAPPLDHAVFSPQYLSTRVLDCSSLQSTPLPSYILERASQVSHRSSKSDMHISNMRLANPKVSSLRVSPPERAELPIHVRAQWAVEVNEWLVRPHSFLQEATGSASTSVAGPITSAPARVPSNDRQYAVNASTSLNASGEASETGTALGLAISDVGQDNPESARFGLGDSASAAVVAPGLGIALTYDSPTVATLSRAQAQYSSSPISTTGASGARSPLSNVHPLAQMYANASTQQRQKAREHAKRLSPKMRPTQLPGGLPSFRRPDAFARKPSVSSPLASHAPLGSPRLPIPNSNGDVSSTSVSRLADALISAQPESSSTAHHVLETPAVTWGVAAGAPSMTLSLPPIAAVSGFENPEEEIDELESDDDSGVPNELIRPRQGPAPKSSPKDPVGIPDLLKWREMAKTQRQEMRSEAKEHQRLKKEKRRAARETRTAEVKRQKLAQAQAEEAQTIQKGKSYEIQAPSQPVEPIPDAVQVNSAIVATASTMIVGPELQDHVPPADSAKATPPSKSKEAEIVVPPHVGTMVEPAATPASAWSASSSPAIKPVDNADTSASSSPSDTLPAVQIADADGVAFEPVVGFEAQNSSSAAAAPATPGDRILDIDMASASASAALPVGHTRSRRGRCHIPRQFRRFNAPVSPFS
ncbi:hypothetical protein OIV83_000546 [Microbotryomycetes sp. JL201]|nr:hypothetical protein OIV83_000546 [Microbotryomycetes sp. JL201]